MIIINESHLHEISGTFGQLAPALAAGYGVWLGAGPAVQTYYTLNQAGHDLGKWVYESTHPNPVGPMVFYK